MQHLTTKPIRTTNRQARDYVRNGIPFRNSNGQLFARWESPTIYVVYSYGEHWPLFIYSTDTRAWYANEDKASPTTSSHFTYAHPLPGDPPRYRSCAWMKRAAREGLGFILLSECEAAQAEAA